MPRGYEAISQQERETPQKKLDKLKTEIKNLEEQKNKSKNKGKTAKLIGDLKKLTGQAEVLQKEIPESTAKNTRKTGKKKTNNRKIMKKV